MKRRLATGLVLAGVVVLGAAAMRRHAHAPVFPRFRRTLTESLHGQVALATKADPRGRDLLIAPPTMPKPSTPPSVAAYASAIAHGADHPGAQSFRADTDAYCDFNAREVADKARAEGVTEGEIRELTYFGFVGLRTTQVGTVARVLGRDLTRDEQTRLAAILDDENRQFTATIHRLVDDGASLDERWDAIRAFEQDYMQQFATDFGMTSAQFDQMLAPDPEGSGDPTDLPGDAPPPATPPTPAGAPTLEQRADLPARPR